MNPAINPRKTISFMKGDIAYRDVEASGLDISERTHSNDEKVDADSLEDFANFSQIISGRKPESGMPVLNIDGTTYIIYTTPEGIFALPPFGNSVPLGRGKQEVKGSILFMRQKAFQSKGYYSQSQQFL